MYSSLAFFKRKFSKGKKKILLVCHSLAQTLFFNEKQDRKLFHASLHFIVQIEQKKTV